ncbi:hypothetical protein ML462_01145 [Gramella lutea]|uniref:Pentapeptide repeat-containing protein n=1 Tax=Christiangramia lutea TaxID=1607951 RepID=A0A9X1V0E3_9FLAO|nr:hypothetical protein [Christiangramia lutea]MCH4821764.1 hypothetical protein [Christiangramia lutea]
MYKRLKYWPILLILIIFLFIATGYLFFRVELAIWAYGETNDRNGQLLKDFLSLSGGLAVLAGLYISFVRSRAIERTVENQQEQIKNQSFEINLTRDSNLNEQFKNAVEHLGDNREPIILGGIAELNQLATNEGSKFGEVVTNIFSSFLKSEANIKNEEDSINWNIVSAIVKNLTENSNLNKRHVDLSYTNLFGTKISGCEIRDWNFYKCNLPKQISLVKFQNCNFDHSVGFLTKFIGVHWKDCSFNGVFLENSRIINSNMDSNSISLTAIDSDIFSGKFFGDLTNSHFFNCDIKNSHFENGFFSDNKIVGTNIYNTHFDIDLMSNSFSASRLNKVKFNGYVSATEFKGVHLNMFNPRSNFEKKIKSGIDKDALLLGVTFNGIHKEMVDTVLTSLDGIEIFNLYNKIVESKAFLKNKKVNIPSEWYNEI